MPVLFKMNTPDTPNRRQPRGDRNTQNRRLRQRRLRVKVQFAKNVYGFVRHRPRVPLHRRPNMPKQVARIFCDDPFGWDMRDATNFDTPFKPPRLPFAPIPTVLFLLRLFLKKVQQSPSAPSTLFRIISPKYHFPTLRPFQRPKNRRKVCRKVNRPPVPNPNGKIIKYGKEKNCLFRTLPPANRKSAGE